MMRIEFPDAPDPRLQRGYGFWRWKPLCIADALEVHDGELVLFTDATMNILNLASIVKLREDADIMLFGNWHTNRGFMSVPCVQTFAVSEEELDTMQIDGSTMLLLSNERTRSFVQRWVAAMRHRNALEDIGDAETIAKIKMSKGHRHDQAILSILVGRNKGPVTIKVIPWQKKVGKAWHHRSRKLAQARVAA
jgi:hypothetical protein